jgi:hypothetical protein
MEGIPVCIHERYTILGTKKVHQSGYMEGILAWLNGRYNILETWKAYRLVVWKA